MKKRATHVLSRSLFVRFLATYVALLLIPFTLSVLVNAALIGEIQDNVEQSQLALLRQARDVVERSIDDLEWRVFQIASNPRLSRLATEYRSGGTENFSLIRETVSYLHGYTLFSSNLKSTFYLYLNEPPIILTPYAMYRHADFSDSRTYLQIEGTSLADWHETVFSRYYRRGFFPARRVTIEDFTNKPMIPYVQSLPVGPNVDRGSVRGALVFFIGEEEFSSLLANVSLPAGGWTYIADENGNVLTGLAQADTGRIRPIPLGATTGEGLFRTEVDGQNAFVAYTHSDDDWKFVAVLPSAPILAPVYNLQRISLTTLIVSILVGMAVASAVSYRNARPLQSILVSIREIVGADVHDVESIRALNSGVRRLIEQRSHLQSQLKRHELFHHNLMVSRLLQGSFRNRNEMQSFLAYLDVTIEETDFIVGIVSLAGFETLDSVEMIDQMNQTKVVLKDLIAEHLDFRVFTHDASDESLSLIAMQRRQDVGDFEQRFVDGLERVRVAFVGIYHGAVLMGVGLPKTDILGIAESYEEARLALAAGQANDGAAQAELGVVRYSATPARPLGYYYPIELEVRISNATRAGDTDALETAFCLLRQENFEHRRIAGNQVRYLYHELFGTFQKLMRSLQRFLPGSIDTQDHYPVESGYEDPEVVESLLARFHEIAAHMAGTKRSHNQQLIEAIVDHIRSNFHDHGLGLHAVASRFSITESYLSFFFKEQTGENFAGFVERTRIDHSVGLLSSTEHPIAEIASLSGYNSDKTFRRVFKKLTGVSPSDYRRGIILRRPG